MSKAELQRIVATYKEAGFFKGGELVIPLSLATSFIDDLSQLDDIGVMGLDGWEYVAGTNGIKEIDSISYYVGDEVTNSSEFHTLSIDKVKQYLLTIPESIPLISFTLDIPMEWVKDIFS